MASFKRHSDKIPTIIKIITLLIITGTSVQASIQAIKQTKLTMNIDEETKFYGLYLNVVQSNRGIEPLLDSMLSFLRRKTDFFDGPN